MNCFIFSIVLTPRGKVFQGEAGVGQKGFSS